MYLINRRPLMALNCGIPEEAWTGKEVNLKHLRIFGCISFVHMNLDHLSKLDTKSKKCIFIGYGTSKYDYHFKMKKTKRSLGIRIWYSMRRCTRTCWRRGALQRRNLKWHLGALRTAGCCGLGVQCDVTLKKVQSIPKGNEELRVEPSKPQNKLRWSTRMTTATERYSPVLHYLLLTDIGEP